MTKHIHINDQVTVGSQPDESEIATLAQQGFKSVVNFRNQGEEEQPLSPDAEGDKVKAQGMHYLHIPVSMKSIRPEQVDELRRRFDELPKPVFAHCKGGKRAGAMTMMYLAVKQGMSGQETIEQAMQMGFECDQPELEQFVKNYVDQHQSRNHNRRSDTKNPLQQIGELGQAIWLDDIHRSLMTRGDLKALIDDDGLCGMTSNPTIFDKAITGSHDYDDDVRALALEDNGVNDIFEALTIKDVQMAADTFRPLYDRTNGRHGFVSLEVSPHLAHDTEGTLSEARRLWAALDRPNVFIKVPATLAGLPAIRQLTSDGISVNITLLFGLPRYRAVEQAYIAGIEDRLARGQDVRHVRSVASFFLSRIDVLVDPMLDRIRKEGGEHAELAESLLGQTAIASAKQAYQMYKDVIRSDRWKKLADSGAWPQWLLWASTSTKNPQYSDVMYIERLIGPETVNTLPIQTLDAYRDHGDPKPRLEDDVDNARRVLESLSKLDIDLNSITQQLENEGIEKFSTSLDKLLETLASEVAAARDSTSPSSA